MASLLIAVIAIAFLGAILVAGMNYVSFDAVRGIRDGGQIHHGFLQLATARLTFRELHRTSPTNLSDLTSSLIREPLAPSGLTWQYDTTGYSWFCLSGTIDENVMPGLRQAKGKLPADAAFLAGACGATEDDEPSTFPAAVALTYYVHSP